MENLVDYSRFVFAAYASAIGVLTLLFAYVVTKYFSLKSKIKNEKSA